MAKDKSKSSGANKHLHARTAYLQRAATYLTTQASKEAVDKQRDNDNEPHHKDDTVEPRSASGLPQHLSDHLMQVARKSQIRLKPHVKQSICKRCGQVLIEGEISTKFTENLSKGGKKPHADVVVIECGFCGAQKRFPVGATRQKKKAQRQEVKANGKANEEVVEDGPPPALPG